MPHEKILVVDDAPINLKLMRVFLRKEGFEVVTAADAEEALSILESFQPDLFLIDIQLPGMNGLELARRLRQDPRTRDIVLVALTACAMKGDEERALKAGCEGYVTKPIETATLGLRIREFLGRRPSARSARMTTTAPDCAGT